MIHKSAKWSLLGAAISFVYTSPVFCQNIAHDIYSSDEIIVSARRVEERLQDVPISMTVFNQAQISNLNIVVPSDLAAYTPSLSVNQRFGPEKASFSIRGFNQENSTQATVGVYFADVIGIRAQGGTTSGSSVGAGAFMDLQNVQVLKGPQGTLFGRNTTGGAILLVPRKPTDRLEGYVEGSLGNFDMRRAQAVLNLPLADTFKVRFAVDRNSREGYMRNRSGIGPDRYNDVNYFAGRMSVLSELTPDLENYVVAHYSNSSTNGYGNRILNCDRAQAATPFTANFSNFARGIGARVGCAQLDRQSARGDSPFDIEVNAENPQVKLQQWQVINTTTWQAGDNLTVKNIASYGEFHENSNFNLFSENAFVPADFPIVGARGKRFQLSFLGLGREGDTAAQSAFTEELQLQGTSFDGSLNWVLGGYLEVGRPLGWSSSTNSSFLGCDSPQDLACDNAIPGFGSYSLSKTKFDFDSKAVFAQGSLKFTEQLSMTLGGRYTFDKIVATGESTRLQYSATTRQFFLTCNDITRFFVTNPATGGRTNLPVNGSNECHNEISTSSKRPTWLVGIDYKPVDDLLIYAKYARGYRQGGINLTNIGFETWKPETLDNFELGAKYGFRGDVTGHINVAAFYNNLRDAQLFGGLGSQDQRIITGGSGIANAGQARIMGVEMDASIVPIRNITFDFAYTYLDSEITDFKIPDVEFPFARFSPNSAEGDPLPFSPKHRLTLTGSYQLPVPDSLGKVSVGATYAYTGRQIANKDTPVFGIIPSTNILNANANWNSVLGSSVDMAVFVTNLTNKIYPLNVSGAWRAFGFTDVMMGQPRMWGFRLRYNFGEQ